MITTDHIVKGSFPTSAGHRVVFEGKVIRLYTIQGVVPMAEVDTPDGPMNTQIADATVIGTFKPFKAPKGSNMKTLTAANIVEGGEPVTYKGKREGIRFATWGKFSDSEWTHFGWSTASDAAKACSAARSTNPYAVELGATSVEVDGETPIRFTKVNGQIGNKPRRIRH